MNRNFTLPSIAKLMMVAMLCLSIAVIASQSTVTMLTAHAQAVTLDRETQAVVAKVTTELNKRTAAIEKAKAGITQSKTLKEDEKAKLKAVLEEVRLTNAGLLTKIGGVKNAAEAQLVALEVDAAYEKYQAAVGQSSLVQDGDAQAVVKQQLEGTADNVQSLIDSKGAAGGNVSSEQKALKGIDQLIQTIGAIIQSIVALLISLAAGDISQAASIFQSILGQLGLNMESIFTAQDGLTGLVSSLSGSLSIGAGQSK
ncbi:hypothetical protein EON76_05045 [bacterium]|nr:MAG: hypothetical protein EON76_05045 [bacterium]